VEAHRVVRRRGFHVFYTVGSQMAVRSDLSSSSVLPTYKTNILHLATLSLSSFSVRLLMNHKVGRNLKEAVVAESKEGDWGEQQITVVRLAGVQTETRTEHLRNTGLRRHWWSNQFSMWRYCCWWLQWPKVKHWRFLSRIELDVANMNAYGEFPPVQCKQR
jgi:hypothetical protein